MVSAGADVAKHIEQFIYENLPCHEICMGGIGLRLDFVFSYSITM